MTIDVPDWAAQTARSLPYPLVFATVSGAHLYGFASVDSDLDLRAAHVLPAAEVLGLVRGPETLQSGVLLTGIHLMRTGEVVADLRVLGESRPYVRDLIAAKRAAEHAPLPTGVTELLAREVPRLRAALEEARDSSPLPDAPSPDAGPALHELVVSTRLATVVAAA